MCHYVTTLLSARYRQVSFDDFLNLPDEDFPTGLITDNRSNTRTYVYEQLNHDLMKTANYAELLKILEEFNKSTEGLRSKERNDLYRVFYIPKKSGGLRKISQPNYELMQSLRRLKDIFEFDFKALYHTTAFAYVKNRSTIDCLKRHQANESRWYAKYDLSDFFGSTSLDFVMKMLSVVFPFSVVCATERGYQQLKMAVELGFLNGGLPQGTPLSPVLTNIIMIPVDHVLSKGLRNFDNNRFVYTRYADDFIISSRYDFSFRKVEVFIKETLKNFGAPFSVNEKKTRYGSYAGANWNLGLMINSNNEITIGHKKKKQFQAMLSSYIMDYKNGKRWDLSDIQVMNGLYSYYMAVEPDVIQRIIAHLNKKFGADIIETMRHDTGFEG